MTSSVFGSGPGGGSSTLEDVEGDRWGAAPADAGYLIRRSHELRRVPLGTLDVEDLRLLLGQQIGVPVLVPLALPLLAREPLAEGDFFPGDLLAAVLRVPPSYWEEHQDQSTSLAGILDRVDLAPDELDGTDLRALISAFGTSRRPPHG